METTLDRFGRVVIPKKIRDRLSLKPGGTLNVDAVGDHVVLKPVGQSPAVETEQGVLVFTGRATGELAGAVEAQREKRLAAVRGDSRT